MTSMTATMLGVILFTASVLVLRWGFPRVPRP
jgi:hypothetical protein